MTKEHIEKVIRNNRAGYAAHQLFKEFEAARQPLVDALVQYMQAMDAIYNHNEAARAVVVQHFGTLHPPEVIKRSQR